MSGPARGPQPARSPARCPLPGAHCRVPTAGRRLGAWACRSAPPPGAASGVRYRDAGLGHPLTPATQRRPHLCQVRARALLHAARVVHKGAHGQSGQAARSSRGTASSASGSIDFAWDLSLLKTSGRGGEGTKMPGARRGSRRGPRLPELSVLQGRFRAAWAPRTSATLRSPGQAASAGCWGARNFCWDKRSLCFFPLE